MEPKVILFEPVGFSANCYALELGDDVALIDVGCETAELARYVEQKGDKIKYILQTHCHYDHILGIESVKKYTPSAKVVIHSLDAEGLKDTELSLCERAGFRQPTVSADIEVSDGDRLPFGNSEILVMHTPGHTVGSVIYIIKDIIFSGDTLFAGCVGRTDLPSGNSRQLLASLNRIKELSGEYRIFPGHENATTLSREKESNYFFGLSDYEDLH